MKQCGHLESFKNKGAISLGGTGIPDCVLLEHPFKLHRQESAALSLCHQSQKTLIGYFLSHPKVGMMGRVFLIIALVTVAYARALAQSSSSEPPKTSSRAQAAPSSSPSQAQCDVTKQMLFLVDVSGSMETNDRLNEAKQFALRIVKEHATKNLLYKLISYGGSCNEIITDVDWTRDATVINAGVKGLYLRGGTPLGSALEFTIDEIKKSAYPDQTKVILLNDGANACGEVSEILTRRTKEIPCVRFISIGIELEEEENGLSSRAMQDAQAIATQTGGSYVPLKDVREIRGVSLSDSAVIVRSVAFEPRPKPQAKAQEKTDEKPQTQASGSASSPQTSSSTQSTSASQTAAQSTGASQTASTTQAEKPQSEKPAEQSASQQSSSQQSSSQQTPSQQSPSTSQGTSSSSQSSSAPQQNTSSQQNAPSQQSTAQSQSVTQKDSSSSSSSRTQEKQSPSQATPQQSASESPSQAASEPASKSEERSVSRSANRRESDPSERMQEPTKSTPQTSTRESLPSPPPTITDNGRELAVIRFPIGSAQLTWDARRSLERLAAELRAELRVHPALVIEVGGHSSREGTSEANLRLSVERAALVARYLRRQTGMREDRVRWTGYGELRPVAGIVRFGSAASRRVEIRLFR